MLRCTLPSAQIAYDRGELETAEAAFVKREPQAKPGIRWIASIEEMRGPAQRKVGDADGAIEHFKASVAAEPERELPLKRLAELYGMRKDFRWGGTGWSDTSPRSRLALATSMERLATTILPERTLPSALKALQKRALRSTRTRSGYATAGPTLGGTERQQAGSYTVRDCAPLWI